MSAYGTGYRVNDRKTIAQSLDCDCGRHAWSGKGYMGKGGRLILYCAGCGSEVHNSPDWKDSIRRSG
jgi:hypothetical protein